MRKLGMVAGSSPAAHHFLGSGGTVDTAAVRDSRASHGQSTICECRFNSCLPNQFCSLSNVPLPWDTLPSSLGFFIP
jgi:hypothetical protein